MPVDDVDTSFHHSSKGGNWSYLFYDSPRASTLLFAQFHSRSLRDLGTLLSRNGARLLLVSIDNFRHPQTRSDTTFSLERVSVPRRLCSSWAGSPCKLAPQFSRVGFSSHVGDKYSSVRLVSCRRARLSTSRMTLSIVK